MTFNDPLFFLVFLPLCLIGFAVLGRFGRRSAIGFLAFMSLVFYAQWSKAYMLLLIGSILFNYAVSVRIAGATGRERAQTVWLIIGIAGDLLALAYFKYLFPLLDFAAGHGWVPYHFSSIILPLGISFFTFTQIAYLVDLKQGVAKRESFWTYLFFVTFFPHLIAGPILHHQDIMPQVQEERRYGLNAADMALGLTWFALGLFKKCVIADRLAPVANDVFQRTAQVGWREGWLGVVMYALQLYFDFSGYSDMAMGLARMFSIRFPLNFNSPFKAGSIIEFWQRWHMTLTHYIMNYVYSPVLLAVSRRRMAQGKKTSRKAVATLEGFLTMIAMPTLFTLFLAGVWHGAGLQFFAYGLAHGTMLTVNHAWRTFLPAENWLRKMVRGPIAVTITFAGAVLAFVLFRAGSFAEALQMYAGLLGRHGSGARPALGMIAACVMLLAVVWTLPNTQEILGQTRKDDDPNWVLLMPAEWQPNLAWCAAACVVLMLAIASSGLATTFLYFQF